MIVSLFGCFGTSMVEDSSFGMQIVWEDVVMYESKIEWGCRSDS